MNDENLRSVSVNDLINGFNDKKICFIVPSYQRGYRWDVEQVKKMLDDLYEFDILKEQNNPFVGDFYCLQPIVLKKLNANEIHEKMGDAFSIDNSFVYYEIVDGQQRMTTLYILLKYVMRDPMTYEIEFERDKYMNFSRKNLLSGLPNSIKNKNKDNSTFADEYYMIQTFETIKEWFANKRQITGKNTIISNLERTVCDKTNVIWYELDSDSDCYSVFKNINNGKIPLTDAELVKAMLLNSKHFMYQGNNQVAKQEQNRFARLWDEIQLKLNNKDLWSFLTGGGATGLPTRIDFLIELIVKKTDNDFIGYGDHKYFSFFEEKLNESLDKKEYIECVFEQLRNCFRTIQDWNEDYCLHNYIGFLLQYSGKGKIDNRINTIIALMNKYDSLSKIEFHNHLIKEIRKHFNNVNITDINYADNGKQVEKLLMLFNIEELNEIRGRFNFMAKKGWSIEHIKAQHSEIVKVEDRKNYMIKEKESLVNRLNSTKDQTSISLINSFISEINTYLNNKNPHDVDFTSLAERIDAQIDGFDDVQMHRLGNLALLSMVDNSSFNNSPFYEKREILNRLLKDPDTNIPFSTNKAFHKMYSRQLYALNFTRWVKQDFDDMYIRQKELLIIDDSLPEIKGFIKEN